MSIADGRANLATILDDAGIVVGDTPEGDPPRVVILQDGSDLGVVILSGQTEWTYRVIAIAGAWDQAGATAQLNALLSDAVAAIHADQGWRVVRVTADRIARIAGGDQLVADIYARTIIDL